MLPIVDSNLRAQRPWIVMPRGSANLAEQLERNEHDDAWRLDVFRKLLEEWPMRTSRTSCTET